MERPYKKCSRCILDTNDDINIKFNENGICNYCIDYDKEASKSVITGQDGINKLEEIVKQIKNYGKNNKYDCLIGLSGGVDSTYLALLAKQHGLRPLAVHFDNGWNSEISVNNINNIVSMLGFDLYTYVINWEEFKDLQLSFIKASVIDIELTSDHAIFGAIMKIAAEHKIKYILSGWNVVTEHVLPRHWYHNKWDSVNIRNIQKKFGTVKLKSFPLISPWKKIYYYSIKRFRYVTFLNYIPYNKENIKAIISRELNWHDYGNKHCESIITRFYQGYILPVKFRVDKRKAHLSTLICSGQLTREQALTEINKPIYDPDLLKVDMDFILKKFGITESEFKQFMGAPIQSHNAYGIEKPNPYDYFPYLKPLKFILGLLRKK